MSNTCDEASHRRIIDEAIESIAASSRDLAVFSEAAAEVWNDATAARFNDVIVSNLTGSCASYCDLLWSCNNTMAQSFSELEMTECLLKSSGTK